MISSSTSAPRKFAGRVAIVTGSTSGIGLAIAHALAAEGADIVMNGFVGEKSREETLQNIEKMRAELAAKHNVRVIFDAADMSKPRHIRHLVRRTIAEFGRVDIAVNNAGIQHVAPTEKFPLSKWQEIIAVNLTAAFVMTKAVLPGMRKRGFGRIINIGSAHSKVSSVNKVAYCAAKAGLLGLTRTVALECANDGITINTICPGWVLTPLVEVQIRNIMEEQHLSYEEATKKLLDKQPMKKFTKVEQVAALAAFLAGDDAETITGTDYSIDGGFVAG
jgi:3-hydroxybutyrate dehydrogenase